MVGPPQANIEWGGSRVSANRGWQARETLQQKREPICSLCQAILTLAPCRFGNVLMAMAKLYFHYSTMNAGKSAILLQAAHNYVERGMVPYLLTAEVAVRDGNAQISSRIGIAREADTFGAEEDLFAKIKTRLSEGPCACIFVDEVHFLSEAQVWQLARAVDDLGVPIMCYGLRVDFRGKLFPGSATLLALADEMREVRTICHCGKKATMVVRQDDTGRVLLDGPQYKVGGNDLYVSLCRRHWREAVGDAP